MTVFDFIQLFAKIAIVVGLSLSSVPFLVWFERRGSAWMQGRVGPNRVGPFGLLQSVADVLKLFLKESFVPGHVNKFFYILGPAVALVAPLGALMVIPFGSHAWVCGHKVILQIAQIDSGLIFLLAFAGLEVYPVILGGWASHNKYTVLGALRGSSQMVSYEIAMGMSTLSMLIIYGTFNLQEMVVWQSGVIFGFLPSWGVLVNPVGALIFFISIFAETNRLPFDIPEGDAEIVAGYHTEYGAMKFAMFFMAEYVAMVMASALIATLYFGGFSLLPGMGQLVSWLANNFSTTPEMTQNFIALFEFISIVLKVGFFLFVFVWVRWTLPRFRFDQLMDLGWKILFPLSFVNLVAVIIVSYFFT